MKRSVLQLLWILTASCVLSAQSGDKPVTFALAGDSIITQRISVFEEPEFLKMIEAIRAADAAYTNLEMLFHDYEPYPSAQSGGTYMRAQPSLLQDILWAGFDIVSLANNHAVDYGIEGLRINRDWVRKSGLAFAGVGDNLPLARAPGYLDSKIGRVALISCASTFPSFGLAGPDRPDVHGRPGVNPLRYTTTYRLDEEGMAALRVVQSKLSAGRGAGAGAKAITFQGNRYELAEKPGVVTAPNEQDLAELTASIRSARKQADWILVAVHSHESAPGSREQPAQVLEIFAHAAVDAGADLLVTTGSHVLEGIEIYKGRLIFYGLGDFLFQNETVEFLPGENYLPYKLGPESTPAEFNDRRSSNDTRGFPANERIWQSVIAFPAFRGGKLERVELLPITLGQKKPRPQRGRPLPAAGEEADLIIRHLAELSAKYGTRIEFQNGKGVIVP